MNDLLWQKSLFTTTTNGGGELFTKPTILAAGDTQPIVQLTSAVVTANAAPTAIVNLQVGSPGQTVVVMFGDANTTVDFTGTNLHGNGGADWAAPIYSSMTCTTPDGTVWYCRLGIG